jgi:2,3-bisphosphoglycerate-independent phosphoglycerate mutase
MGVELRADEIAFRLNLVTLERRAEDTIIMRSHSAGNLSAEEGRGLVETLGEALNDDNIRIYPGVAYRHLLVWKNGPDEVRTIPPHDVLDENMAPYLSESSDDSVVAFIRHSWGLLETHPVNERRRNQGLKEANSVWLWGQGKSPHYPLFSDMFNLHGGVISAVDLLKGIGALAGLERIHVEGATGYLDTNYAGKAHEALRALQELDFVFIHVEAPDEAGHSGDWEEKIEAIENIDEKVLGPLLEGLMGFPDFRIMVVSDHLTPVVRRTHTSGLTPFAWAEKSELRHSKKVKPFSEASANASGLIFDKGTDLLPEFLGKCGP